MRRLLLAFLLLLPFSLPAAQAEDFGALQKKAEQLRGLTFKKPVPISMVDAKTLKSVLEAQLKKEYSEDDWPVMEKTLKAFSLIPPKMNLKAVMAGLLEDQVVGLYDPYQKKLFVNDRPVEGSEILGELAGKDFRLGDVYIIHEMVHALTDQYFDLNGLPINDKDNEDRASAARCVVEGDATWVMMRYMGEALNLAPEQQSQMGDLVMGMNLGRELLGSSIPAYLQENLLIAYLGGMNLVKVAYEKGGFAAVNRLYTRPPESMEQVLHPEKYFAGNDPPLQVRIVPPKAFNSVGWKKVMSGTWGEFNVRLILREGGADEDSARSASEGWGGDRYEVYEGPDGKLAFAWSTAWDTDRDASEFAEAVGKAKDLVVVREGKTVMLTKGAPSAGVVKGRAPMVPAA